MNEAVHSTGNSQPQHAWVQEFGGAVTVCDPTGVIVAMNDRAAAVFAKDGGYRLVGSNLLDCHPEPSRTKLAGLLASPRVNVYSIEKGGVRKLVHQSPWYDHGEYAGLVEVVLELPATVPHFAR